MSVLSSRFECVRVWAGRRRARADVSYINCQLELQCACRVRAEAPARRGAPRVLDPRAWKRAVEARRSIYADPGQITWAMTPRDARLPVPPRPSLSLDLRPLPVRVLDLPCSSPPSPPMGRARHLPRRAAAALASLAVACVAHINHHARPGPPSLLA